MSKNSETSQGKRSHFSKYACKKSCKNSISRYQKKLGVAGEKPCPFLPGGKKPIKLFRGVLVPWCHGAPPGMMHGGSTWHGLCPSPYVSCATLGPWHPGVDRRRRHHRHLRRRRRRRRLDSGDPRDVHKNVGFEMDFCPSFAGMGGAVA